MKSIARTFALAGFGLLAVALVVPAPAANASIGGVTLNATGVGFQWTFNQPGAPIPSEPTGEMEQAYSTADFNSGPTTHAHLCLVAQGVGSGAQNRWGRGRPAQAQARRPERQRGTAI